MRRRTSRHLLATTLAAALALTACGPQEADVPLSDVDPTATSSSSEATASPTPTASDDAATAEPTEARTTSVPALDDEDEGTPADQGTDDQADGAAADDSGRDDNDPRAAGGDVPSLGDHCTMPVELANVDRIEFAAPDGWRVGDGCEFFDPAAEQVESNTEPDVAVSVDVTDTPFHEAAASGRETRDEIRHVGARSGYQMVRIRAEATGRGLYPEGTPVLLHLVDLDPGTDEDGGTLVLAARPSSGADFPLAAEALDRMIDTVRVVPTADDAGEAAVVSRVEGGGAPWTVTWTGDCLRLHAGAPDGDVVDEACDLPAAQDGIRGVVLGDGGLQVVAGFAPARSALVESDAASAPYGAVTQPLEGSAAFAYTPIDTPVQVRALDPAGDRLASATVS